MTTTRRLLADVSVLAVGAAWPIARALADPLGSLPGFAEGDVFKHAWSFWHTPAALAAGSWPHTPFLGAPEGGVLLDVMLVPSLLLAPITLAAGPVLATNVWVWLSLWAVGVATWALAREVVGDRVGALVAGLVAQTSPYLLGYPLMSGVHERLAVWVFPLVLLALLRARDGGGRGWMATGAIGLGVATVGCQVYGVFAAAMGLLALPVLLRPASWRRVVTAAAWMGAALVACYLFVAWATEHPASLAPQSWQRLELSLTSLPSQDVASPDTLLDPRAARTQKASVEGDLLLRVVYLGWVPLLAAVAGAWRVRGPRRWDVVGIVLVGLSFGWLSLGEAASPLHGLLSAAVPMYGSIPPRWQQLAAFGPLTAVGIAALIASWPTSRGRLVLAAALVTLTLGERVAALPLPLPLPAASARIPPIYRHIDGPGAVVDIPRLYRGSRGTAGIAFLAQSRHEQPILSTINLGDRPWDASTAVASGWSEDWPRVVFDLRASGVRWVVVHPDWFGLGTDPQRAAWGIGQGAGQPRAVEGGAMLWDLGGSTAP